MIFEFVDGDDIKKVEVDDECVSSSYIDLEILNEEENENKTEESEKTD